MKNTKWYIFLVLFGGFIMANTLLPNNGIFSFVKETIATETKEETKTPKKETAPQAKSLTTKTTKAAAEMPPASDPPIIVTTAPTALDLTGNATVSNYNASYTYTSTPVGLSVGAGGVISGITAGTLYTITATDGAGSATSDTFTTRDISSTDTDGDGVIDEFDLDDDNDGILDTVEGCSTVAKAPQLIYKKVFTAKGTNNPSGTINIPVTGTGERMMLVGVNIERDQMPSGTSTNPHAGPDGQPFSSPIIKLNGVNSFFISSTGGIVGIPPNSLVQYHNSIRGFRDGNSALIPTGVTSLDFSGFNTPESQADEIIVTVLVYDNVFNFEQIATPNPTFPNNRDQFQINSLAIDPATTIQPTNLPATLNKVVLMAAGHSEEDFNFTTATSWVLQDNTMVSNLNATFVRPNFYTAQSPNFGETPADGMRVKAYDITGVTAIPAQSLRLDSNDWAHAAVRYIKLIPTGCFQDTDGDGIPDARDLDSDNDGCLDAIEGGGAFTISQLVAPSGTASVGAGSSATPRNFGITVDANGVPTAVGASGQTAGDSQNAAVNLQCNPVISGATTICVGATTTLAATGTPAATNPWVSSNTAVATVSSTGVVTGVSGGTVTITFTNESGYTDTHSVSVSQPTITGSTVIATIGGTTQLTGSPTAAAVAPWVSSNTAVATVSSTGLVTGVSNGTATITYTNSTGCTATTTVSVGCSSVITGAATLCQGATSTYTTINAGVTWASSDTNIATITSGGVLTAVGGGTVTITATSAGCGIAFKVITITENPDIDGGSTVCTSSFLQLSGYTAGNHVFGGTESTNFGQIDLSTSTRWTTDDTSGDIGYWSAIGTATYTGADDAHNINGYVKHYADAANQGFTFPVGMGNDLRSLSISGTRSADSQIAVNWIPGDPSVEVDPTNSNATHSITSFGTGILGVSKWGQWDWQNVAGTFTGTVTVSIPDMTGFATDKDNLRLVGWDGTQWVNLSGSTGASALTENATLSGTMVAGIQALGIGSIATAGTSSNPSNATAVQNSVGTWASSDTAVATVSANGLVTPLTAGTTTITYTENGCSVTKVITVTQCISYCYKPGATGGTVLETKHGITALGRAGADNGNWPMARKGAWTVLESKAKGFVINRVKFNASNQPVATDGTTLVITTPVEGMMVYDTTNNCLKLYTTKGTGPAAWHCLTTQTCPD